MNINDFRNGSGPSPGEAGRSDMFKEFEATELYCPRCKRAVPVRKRLLLVIPEGDKYEYLCAFCAESVGSKIDRQQKPLSVIV
ncbi:MAG: cytoplasmic protein [Deltaproteobacteria bacterium]|nr:cytoplasmic protein [Deltaproteobacteria bacterium]